LFFFVLLGSGDEERGAIAYVTYALSQDAVTAVETLSKHKFGSNKVNLKLAKGRIEQIRPKLSSAPSSRSDNLLPVPNDGKKLPRPKPINKKSRLIIRNLSFNVRVLFLHEFFQVFSIYIFVVINRSF